MKDHATINEGSAKTHAKVDITETYGAVEKQASENAVSMSLLDLEAKYVGKMFAEVAKSMCARRFGLKGEEAAVITLAEMDKFAQRFMPSDEMNCEKTLETNLKNEIHQRLDEADADYIQVDEGQIVLSDVVSIETPDDEIYTSDLMKSLARTKQNSGFKAHIILPKVSVPLSSDWRLLSPSQNLNQFGTPTRLRYTAESMKYFANILKRQSPYCCWNVYENFVKKPGSRKEGCVYFRARAKCSVKDCEHNAILTIGSQNSERLQILFNNDVLHKRGNLAANKICGKARDDLANYFVENNTVPPSQKYRDDLNTLSETTFLAGDMSGVGTSIGAYQKIASLARQAANSCEAVREQVLSLQESMRQMDEEESVKLGWTFRTEFGYIQKPIINPDNLQIILMDQIMTMLYHEHVCNDVLYIDATGSVTDQAKWLSRVLYYVAVVRHPYGRTPPLPVAEFITNKHDQFAIEEFLRMLHEKEYRKYKQTTNPRMVMTDFSWAIIQACLKVFCNETLTEYLNRAYRIVTGSADGEDFLKTRLHVCAAHMMKLNKIHANAKHCKKFDAKSQVHFAMRLFGRLMNCQSLDDAFSFAKYAKIVLTTAKATSDLKDALDRIQRSINTFEEVREPDTLNDPYLDIEEQDIEDFMDDGKEEPKRIKSNFHQLWRDELDNVDESDCSDSDLSEAYNEASGKKKRKDPRAKR